MNIARILYPVKVLGPGNRIGLWLCGCDRACKGCSNPELWHKKPEYELSVSEVVNLIQMVSDSRPIEGFTITGGEPMNQSEELAILLKQLRSISTDILVYSGFEIEELYAAKNPSIDSILHSIAVLIDGSYVESLNDNSVLRGSSNQKIHILDPVYRDLYQEYLAESHNQIQNFVTTDGIVSVGIHRKTF